MAMAIIAANKREQSSYKIFARYLVMSYAKYRNFDIIIIPWDTFFEYMSIKQIDYTFFSKKVIFSCERPTWKLIAIMYSLDNLWYSIR